jgi:copper chaperone CopZ
MKQHLKEKNIAIKVEGIDCFYCFKVLGRILRDYDGVQEEHVGLDSGVAKINYQENKKSVEEFIKELDDSGYKFRIL